MLHRVQLPNSGFGMHLPIAGVQLLVQAAGRIKRKNPHRAQAAIGINGANIHRQHVPIGAALFEPSARAAGRFAAA